MPFFPLSRTLSFAWPSPYNRIAALAVADTRRAPHVHARIDLLDRHPCGRAGLMELARFATHQKRLFAVMAGIFKDAFQAHPDWAEASFPLDPNGVKCTNRFYAARTAAMVAGGKGHATKVNDVERAAWRRQARDWMAAELAGWKTRLDARTPEAAAEIARLLTYAQADGWLAALREAASTNGQPASERTGFQRLYAASARLYADAFAIEIKLANDSPPSHRYNAACAAALAGSDRGSGADQPDDKERAKLRAQALDWLHADLAYWTNQAKSGKPSDRAQVQQTMKHWQTDTDLAGIRDRPALALLPPEEREAFNRVWADVAALLKQTQPNTKAPPR